MKSTNLSFLILIGIILVMGYFLIFKQPAPVIEPFDDTEFREEIRIKDSTAVYWQENSAAWQTIADKLGSKADSLENLKPSIQHHYEEKYNFNNNATTTQLDSIIRSIW